MGTTRGSGLQAASEPPEPVRDASSRTVDITARKGTEKGNDTSTRRHTHAHAKADTTSNARMCALRSQGTVIVRVCARHTHKHLHTWLHTLARHLRIRSCTRAHSVEHSDLLRPVPNPVSAHGS